MFEVSAQGPAVAMPGLGYGGYDDGLGLGPDQEAIDRWLQIGVRRERIVQCPRSENFWQAGPIGPDPERGGRVGDDKCDLAVVGGAGTQPFGDEQHLESIRQRCGHGGIRVLRAARRRV